MVESPFVQCGPFSIRSVPAHPFDYDTHPRLLALSNIAAWSLWACYLVLQAVVITTAGNSTGPTWRCWMGLFAELCISCNDLVHALHLIVQLTRTAKVQTPRPHYRLMNDDAPTVDVLVPSCGEPVEVVVNTAASAAGQDYPGSCLRVMVLDDGNDQDLRRAIEKLDRSKVFDAKILYGTRSSRGKDFKAGNLRFGIEETAKMEGAEFIASLDADMIADSEWLRRMVPHLLLDSKMAMVNQPQHYYNTAKNDPLSDQGEFDLWFTIFEPLNDRVGQAMCQGSGFVVRRSAIEDIGGWPLAQTGEDVMCSLRLLAKGWRLAFVREYLQHGTTADTLGARLKQKGRWAIDHIEFIGAFGIRSVTAALGALTWRELTSITTTIGLVLLPATLLSTATSTTQPPISTDQYSLLLAMLTLTFLAGRINDFIVYRHAGLSRLSRYQSLETWSAPFAAHSLLQRLNLLSHVSPATPTFFVTGAFRSPINERSRTRRAPLPLRLRVPAVQAFLCYALVSAGLVLWRLSSSSTSPPTALPGPTLRLAACVWKIAVPVWYMVFPPDVPAWHELVVRDRRGVLRPKREVDRIMAPEGSEGDGDDGWARVGFDAVEVGVLSCLVGRGLW